MHYRKTSQWLLKIYKLIFKRFLVHTRKIFFISILFFLFRLLQHKADRLKKLAKKPADDDNVTTRRLLVTATRVN